MPLEGSCSILSITQSSTCLSVDFKKFFSRFTDSSSWYWVMLTYSFNRGRLTLIEFKKSKSKQSHPRKKDGIIKPI